MLAMQLQTSAAVNLYFWKVFHSRAAASICTMTSGPMLESLTTILVSCMMAAVLLFQQIAITVMLELGLSLVRQHFPQQTTQQTIRQITQQTIQQTTQQTTTQQTIQQTTQQTIQQIVQQ